MTVSARHENSVQRSKMLIRKLGHTILENDWQAGKGGYKLPRVECPDGKLRSFIIDCCARLRTGAMIAVEVELNHETTQWKKWALSQFGIILVPNVTPSSVDQWMQDPKLLEVEIEHWIKHQPLPVLAR